MSYFCLKLGCYPSEVPTAPGVILDVNSFHFPLTGQIAKFVQVHAQSIDYMRPVQPYEAPPALSLWVVREAF